MSKIGIYKISGNTSPVVGTETIYHIDEWYPDTPLLERNPMNVTWELFVQGKNGRFTSTHIKKKGISHFTFGEKAWRYTYRLEAYLQKPEGKEPMSLIINPQPSKIPQINKVELYYIDDEKGNIFSFFEKLRAKAHCVNLSNEELLFTLWEDDVKGKGHDSKNLLVETAKAKVNPRNGVAVAEFMLTKGLMTKAMRGEHDGQLEFYVTVEYYKNKKHESENVNVQNPIYKVPPPIQHESRYKPKETQHPIKAQGSPAAQKPKSKKEEKGIWDSMLDKGKELWDVAESKIATATKDKEPAKKVDKTNKAVYVDKPDEVDKKKNGCPNCEKDITLEQIRSICVGPKNKKGVESCLIKDDAFIKAALPFLNKYRKKADINSCITKAHFIAQICQETKFYDLQEGFKYSNYERMRKLFNSYFKQFGNLEKQRAEAQRLSDLSMDSKNWKTVANAIYGKTHPLGKNNTDKDDGWRYSGKGFKQITWRDNYLSLQGTVKNIFKKEVNWVDNDNPYKLKNIHEDAILSALAFWKKYNISNVATKISNDAVTNVTSLINPALIGLDERKRFFKKAVEILQVNKCKPEEKVNSNNENGTIVIVSGTDTKIEKDAFKPTEYSWLMYKTSVYRNMSLKTYYTLEKNNKLPDADYITYLSRDTHQTSTSKGKILTHSDKRFGQYNEIPPGEYYLVPGVSGQKYSIYVIDSEDKSAAAENGIDGPDGSRGGVALHQYCPRFSVGCFTFNSGKDKSPIQKLIDNLPDLPVNDKKPVRFIIQPRKVKESTWDNSDYGTKKWTGI